MGLIARLKDHRETGGESRARWRQIFGATDKEESRPPAPHNSYVRSAASAATARFIGSLRSLAPGGWSDDRWEQEKHFVGLAYVGIHRICTRLQQSEFQVWKKDKKHPDGKRPVTEDDPSERMGVKPYDLVKLLEKPNRQDYFGKLMYRWGQQKYLTGTALTFMVPSELGTPCELYCIPTALAIPQPVVNNEYPDGFYRIQPVYPYGPFSSYPTPNTSVGAPIPAQWMLRFQYPHPILRYDGYSPLTGLRLHLDEVEMMDRSRHYSMRRSINPSAVLQLEEMEGAEQLPEPEIERIRAEFESAQQGPENHGNLFVAAAGGRLEPWGAKPVDMDYQSGWDQLTSFCLGGLGITKPAAGMVEDSSYATLYATLKQLNLITLDPECADIGAELTRHLAHHFGDDLIVEVRCPKINDDDLKNAKLGLLQAGFAITKNELRKETDMPLTKEPWGEELAGTPPAPPPGQGMPGMEGQPGAPGAPEPPALDDQDEREVANGAPTPGNLGAGALGPRKMYQRARGLLLNGRHK